MKKTTKIETIHGQRIKCYDNGGATVDRYTVVFLDQPEPAKGHFACLGMNREPFHPQGFGQHSAAMDGSHLGKPVALADLPEDCQKLVLQDLKPEATRPDLSHSPECEYRLKGECTCFKDHRLDGMDLSASGIRYTLHAPNGRLYDCGKEIGKLSPNYRYGAQLIQAANGEKAHAELFRALVELRCAMIGTDLARGYIYAKDRKRIEYAMADAGHLIQSVVEKRHSHRPDCPHCAGSHPPGCCAQDGHGG